MSQNTLRKSNIQINPTFTRENSVSAEKSLIRYFSEVQFGLQMASVMLATQNKNWPVPYPYPPHGENRIPLNCLKCCDKFQIIISSRPSRPMVGLHSVCSGADPKWVDLALGGNGGSEIQPPECILISATKVGLLEEI
jgi:hypothetical protein